MNANVPVKLAEQDECVPSKRLCTDQNAAQYEVLGGDAKEDNGIDVSIILPVYNASCWLDECLQAVLEQDFQGTMELSVFDDASKPRFPGLSAGAPAAGNKDFKLVRAVLGGEL
ncbi:hypothetical protein JZ751_025776, partial [Albula glossodonta]